ncbi:MAG: HU family DNA-binding protein [Phycisphaerales bacterium]|nr:MAG: HU family DNA-binding protein [Phycisphaerales bacterium]
MNKSDLIERVARDLGESKTTASRVVEAVIKNIADGVRTERKVTIAGFGCFEKKQRAAREGVNPATRERMVIGPSKTVGFRASQQLKETL